MPRLRPLRKAEDIAKVPETEPVEIETAPLEEKKPVVKAKEEPELELEPEVEVVPEPEEKEEEEVSLLKAQVDKLTKAEEAARTRAAEAERQRLEAVKQAQNYHNQATKHQGDAEQAQFDSLLSAIGAAQAEADTAQRDWESAAVANDVKAQGDAQRRLSRAEARIDRLEDGKASFEARMERKPEQTRVEQPQQQVDQIEAHISSLPNLTDRERDWLRGHKDVLTDPRKNSKLGSLYWEATDVGHTRGSDEYFKFIEEGLGYRQKEAIKPKVEPEVEERRTIVSAPVSRDTPSPSTGRPSSTRITLTPEQREAARIAGVDEVTYAKQLITMNSMKATGHYREN